MTARCCTHHATNHLKDENLSATMQWKIPQQHISLNGSVKIFSSGWRADPTTNPQSWKLGPSKNITGS